MPSCCFGSSNAVNLLGDERRLCGWTKQCTLQECEQVHGPCARLEIVQMQLLQECILRPLGAPRWRIQYC